MSQICPISKTCACRNVARCRTKEAGRLFLWFPVPHTLKKVTSYLQQFALKYELMHKRPGLSLDCRPGQSQEIARNLAQLLAPRELRETQVLFVQGAIQPQLHDFSDITSLQRFMKLNQSDWLVEMLATERFTSYFQPIVSIKDTSQIYGYESLLRGLDEQGNLVLPGPILELATEAGLLPQLDQVGRLSAIAQFSRHQVSGQIFINFAPTSLYDPAFCLHTTLEAIDQAGISHERVVFEVVESDNLQDLDHLKTVLKYYRDAGFLIALDDLGSGYSSLNLLHQLRPDFIKLDMELIQDVHQNPYKASITEKLLEITQNLNIQSVVEGIECIEELNWLRERGATFAQGYLIGKPSEVPVTTTPHFDPIALTLASADGKQVEQHVQHQSESERIVAAVTQRIRQSLELDEILQTTAAEVRQLFEVDRVVIYQFEPDWSGLVAVESLAEGCMSIQGYIMDTCFQPSRAAYFQQGKTRAIEDIETPGLSPCHVSFLRSLQIRAYLIVPILQQERLWGLLIAHQCHHARQWQQSEINLFNQLAGQAAIAIQQSELYHQLQQANHELQRLACSDGLTQVANRRCFDDTFNAQWQRLAQEQALLSLILCDVDYFKLYNDTYGHLAGDDALRQVAKAISQTVKHPTDLVARYGGEEFAVILPNTDIESAIAVARDIQNNVNALKKPHPHSQVSEFITLSLGVATITPHSQLSPATLIATADQGLYQAKAQGRNCVVQMDCEEVEAKSLL
ncbi:EAL domain-containing protein [Nostoc sp. UHCC 0926]|uniref:EAL domain-containing protein n=1 Tax=unclassified Nostoc TaxID=2593658 RepID=UPI0023607473|nr:EAL domain-containing protein [Nostoc sp. UHCC 0926]WDD35092.1 EAL domain-containing protein [Nostoc sp. UHCC 0926]